MAFDDVLRRKPFEENAPFVKLIATSVSIFTNIWKHGRVKYHYR